MNNTILWALSSKCNFHCKYCYLNFPEDENPVNNSNTASIKDLDKEQMLEFISKFRENNIKRVFIAGAEPLSNCDKTFKIIEEIKNVETQVILCTNGYALNNENCRKIIEKGVDAVSISLDSYDAVYNNKYRQYPSENGWETVIRGIKNLVKEKEAQKANTKIGIYTVLTKLNIKDLEKTYNFVSVLGVDYYIFQPIFLGKESKMYKELSLTKDNLQELTNVISQLYINKTRTHLPNKQYVNLMLESIECSEKKINNCFAGETLFFITPDGSIHPCPSSKSIVIEKNVQYISDNLQGIFQDKKLKIKDCKNFSEDCVNMWQLIAFDEIIGREK